MEFLGKIAQTYYEKEQEQISKLCFIFPGRRAALFFQRELGSLIQKPIFSPYLITITDLFSELSGLRKVDKLDCIYTLYKIYSSNNESAESFDDFIYWGETLLADFDDTDKFLANAPKLFANIKDLKELDSDYSFLSERQFKAIQTFWSSFHNGEESDKKSKFKALWSLMLPLYSQLRIELQNKGTGYEGMIYRKIAEEIIEGDTYTIDQFLNKFNKVVFIGFNALNECEKSVMNYIKKSGKGDFYWDYCGEMVTDNDNKASLFIKDNMIKYPSAFQLDFTTESKQEIEVIGAPTAIGQAKIAGDIIANLPVGINSAVILPEESLLTSLMSSIDNSCNEINITMGYPLRESSIISLAERLIELQTDGFYYKRVLAVLKHRYIIGVSKGSSLRVEKAIISGNMIYVPTSLFSDEPFLKTIFQRVGNEEVSEVNRVTNLSRYILDILDYIVRSEKVSKFEKELIYYLYTLIARLKDLDIPMSYSTFLRLLKQLVNSTSVPFKGEPLAGLQVMGVLESRCLDFDNIILCSMNEGVFPPRNLNTSFIPINIRRAFSLPDNEYADAVSAYNFYRTIYRAKRVWLLYDTRSEGLTAGEQSRFILQLKFHYRVPFIEMVSSGLITRRLKQPIIVTKDEQIIERLSKFKDGTRSFSASSLSTYIQCPLKFYFLQIEGVKEEDQLSESIESRTFGTILHNSMASLYRDLEGKNVNKGDLESKLSNHLLVDKIIETEFKQEKGVNEIKGYNFIICHLIARYIRNIIKYDLTLVPFRYLESEKKFSMFLNISDDSEIKLMAFVDRLDRVDGVLRIVDYKTGKGPDYMKSIDELFMQNSSKNLSVYFQLYLYALMVPDGSASHLTPYFLRELGSSFVKFSTPEDIELFKELLILKISDILNPDIPFVQTDNIKSCEYCLFKQICR
ncbi:MAG: PD-(D/E)XK nuclease family protein [Bacteroidales bacterium]|jgi:CRISPR/Cas system-associated exonuclease Cas4 (RecB family)|nr:PD-(D/E)XK nuclease family protein [Bacteroidales bacterium]